MTLIPAALLAACGGGNDSTPETPIVTPTVERPTSLSKVELIKQGDRICAEVNAALGTLSSSSTGSASATGQRADLYQGMIERLRGLGEPTDQTGLDDFFGAGDDIVSAQKKAEQATQGGDDAALASAESEAASAESAFASAASAYGFKDCGQGPTTPSSTATAPSASTPAAPVTPATPATPAPSAPTAPSPGATGTGGGAGGTGTGGGSAGTGGGTGGSGGVGPG
jgi:hypothetical protein